MCRSQRVTTAAVPQPLRAPTPCPVGRNPRARSPTGRPSVTLGGTHGRLHHRRRRDHATAWKPSVPKAPGVRQTMTRARQSLIRCLRMHCPWCILRPKCGGPDRGVPPPGPRVRTPRGRPSGLTSCAATRGVCPLGRRPRGAGAAACGRRRQRRPGRHAAPVMTGGCEMRANDEGVRCAKQPASRNGRLRVFRVGPGYPVRY